MAGNISFQLQYMFLRSMRALVLALPEGGRASLGNFLGGFAGFALPSRKRLILENIRYAMPEVGEEEARAIMKESLRNLGRVAVEILAVDSLDREKMEKLVRFEGEEILRDALAGGKGALVLTSHQGNWEYTNLALAARGYGMSVVGRRIKNPKVDAFITAMREHFGTKFIHHRNAVRPVLRALAAGEIAGFLLDQRAQAKEGILSEFFGRPVSTNPGLALIALRSGAPVVFCWSERVEEGFVVHFDGVIKPPESGSREELVRSFTMEFDKWMERAIRRRPGQWFWVHRRFRVPGRMAG
jgi:KDO2-lipid IV(A) lauroyltransferase